MSTIRPVPRRKCSTRHKVRPCHLTPGDLGLRPEVASAGETMSLRDHALLWAYAAVLVALAGLEARDTRARPRSGRSRSQCHGTVEVTRPRHRP